MVSPTDVETLHVQTSSDSGWDGLMASWSCLIPNWMSSALPTWKTSGTGRTIMGTVRNSGRAIRPTSLFGGGR